MSAIKTKVYNGNLYRANERSFTPFSKASNNYRGAPMKYFTLDKGELSAYTRYGKPYVKTWATTEDLELVDILDINTRKALEAIPALKDSLSVAFPIIRNKVSRVSTEETKHHDDIVLKIICDLGYDGYYMKRLTNNNRYVFHSEVGLCPRAFYKLELQSVKRNAPPETRRNNSNKKKSRSRFTRRNNNNNNNNMGMYFSPPVRPRGSLF
jgi:hypothetical protein